MPREDELRALLLIAFTAGRISDRLRAIEVRVEDERSPSFEPTLLGRYTNPEATPSSKMQLSSSGRARTARGCEHQLTIAVADAGERPTQPLRAGGA